MDELIRLQGVSVTRGGVPMLQRVDFTLRRGEHWGIVGPNGSGKTTLVGVLRGDVLPDPGGMRHYDFGTGRQSTVLGLRQRMGLVSTARQEFYTLHGRRAKGMDVILAGFFDAPFLQQAPDDAQYAAAEKVVSELNIRFYVDLPMSKLSTGQVRMVLLARALAHGAEVLFLDECLDGLDEEARAKMLEIVQGVAPRTTIVWVAHRASGLPPCVQRVAVMDEGRIVVKAGYGEGVALLREQRQADRSLPPVPVEDKRDFDYLVRISRATVVRNGVAILHDIDWTVLPGEHWAVLGPNGAGKSTLLGLIRSENAPYADGPDNTGSVERLGGIPMDEARPRIGVISADLQASYGRELGRKPTVEETVLSGFRNSVGLVQEPTAEEVEIAWEWMKYLGISRLADLRLEQLSQGQQRLALLARAVVSVPDLLLLDEPLDGLDPATRQVMCRVFDRLAQAGTALILVSHHREDLVESINRVLLLEGGRVAFCGDRKMFSLRQERS